MKENGNEIGRYIGGGGDTSRPTAAQAAVGANSSVSLGFAIAMFTSSA